VADVNGTVSAINSLKVETVNGKRVSAGITLGSNGETSDIIMYADRFSLFNRNNKATVPVMIAEGNELYIDSARIKNGSIDTAKIKDATITSAKIAGALNSVNYNWATGNTGWCLNMNGDMVLNNAVVRGHIEASSGTFNGDVRANTIIANQFIGDIANIGVFPTIEGTKVRTRCNFVDSTAVNYSKNIIVNAVIKIMASRGSNQSSKVMIWIAGNTKRYDFDSTMVANGGYFYIPIAHAVEGIASSNIECAITTDGGIMVEIMAATATMTRGSGSWQKDSGYIG
jgi:predicted phage tail protein